MHNIAPLVEYWRTMYHGTTSEIHACDKESSQPPYMIRPHLVVERHVAVAEHPTVKEWVTNPLSQDFTTALDEADVDSTAKSRKIKELLDKIKKKTRKDDTCCKVMIATDDTCTVAAYQNLLETHYKGDVQPLVAMSSAKKKMAEEIYNNENKKWILIATRESVGEGRNLQRANHVITVDSCNQWSTIMQLLSRAW
jgi:hypothetical protein